jgi:hypothetical protein
MSTFATANVYGEVREEVDLPYIKKTGDTATGLIIFDGGLETNIGTSTFNGPIIATDQITFRPEAELYCNCPSEFADDVTVTGGSFVVDVPATFNDTVIYNDGITFNNIVTCTDQVQLTSTSSLSVAGNSTWDAGASLNVNCIAAFNSSQTTFGSDPNLNQTMTGVALITQDNNNSKVSSVTADQINLADQVASVVSQSSTLTSTFLNIDNFNTGAESALTNDGVYFSNNTNPNAGSKLDLLECRVTSTPLTYANISVVGGNPTVSVYQNDGLGTVNLQSNVTSTGFGCQDNLYQTNAAINVGGFISATCRSSLYTQPMLQLKNNLLSATGVFMEAYKEKPSAGVAGDEIFRLSMTGKNSANSKEEYGRITCNIRDPSGPGAGADGQLLFAVPVGDTMSTFIDINGNSNNIKIFKSINLQSSAYIYFPDGSVQTTAYTAAISQLVPTTPPSAPTGTSYPIFSENIPKGLWITQGFIGFVTQDGTGSFDNITLTISNNGVTLSTFAAGDSSVFSRGVVIPPILFNASGAGLFVISANCNTTLGNNWTFSNAATQTAAFCYRYSNF